MEALGASSEAEQHKASGVRSVTKSMLARRVALAAKRHPIRWLAESIVVYGFGWSLLEPAFGFLGVETLGSTKYGFLVAASLAIGGYRSMPTIHVECPLPASNTILAIQFGDLFLTPGLRAIPVNEFFDSQLGIQVSPKSLHGQLLSRGFGGHPDAFDRQVTAGLQGKPSGQVDRTSGKVHCYAIGTSVEVTASDGRYLLFALAHTDTATLKAFADISDLWQALGGLWKSARTASNGDPIVVPLAGGGISGVGLPPQHLLSFLVMSAVEATKRERIADRIVIVLPPALFEQVRLRPAMALLR